MGNSQACESFDNVLKIIYSSLSNFIVIRWSFRAKLCHNLVHYDRSEIRTRATEVTGA